MLFINVSKPLVKVALEITRNKVNVKLNAVVLTTVGGVKDEAEEDVDDVVATVEDDKTAWNFLDAKWKAANFLVE